MWVCVIIFLTSRGPDELTQQRAHAGVDLVMCRLVVWRHRGVLVYMCDERSSYALDAGLV